MGYLQEIQKLVGSRRIFVPGVRAVIVNKAGDILLQRRTDTALWGLPGGAVEPDETAFEALKREVAEETALTVINAEPMALYCGPDQKFTYPKVTGCKFLRLPYLFSMPTFTIRYGIVT